jgi:phosphoglycolate phosphatase
MSIQTVIFDFDGTIADSHSKIIEIINRLSGEFGYPPVDDEELIRLKNSSSKEILKNAKISLFKIPFLVRRVQKELRKEIDDLNLIEGIREALLELKAQGYQLGIITSNVKNNVLAFLQTNELDRLFDFIYSGTNLFGKHRTIKRVLKRHNLKVDRVIYIGDETRDIVSSKRSKIKVIAVAWGFNSVEVLEQYQPDSLIHHPQELLKAIQNSQELVASNQ